MSKDDPHLVMTSSSSPDHNITRQVDNNKVPKELGVYMNFKGTFSVQAKKMRLKFDMMAQQLRPVSMSPLLARSQVLLHCVSACCQILISVYYYHNNDRTPFSSISDHRRDPQQVRLPSELSSCGSFRSSSTVWIWYV